MWGILNKDSSITTTDDNPVPLVTPFNFKYNLFTSNYR